MVSLKLFSSPIFGAYLNNISKQQKLIFTRSTGPPFTHPTLPNYAHYIGSATPRSSSHYFDAVQALIQTYRLDIQNLAIDTTVDQDSRIADAIPIVVNTMVWTKGLGLDLTQRIESMLDATDVFDIQTQ